MATSHSEPTEAPTPERLLAARRRGQVAVSRDLTAACALTALIAVAIAGAPDAWAQLLALFQRTLRLSDVVGPAGAGGVSGAGAAKAVGGFAAAGRAALACATSIVAAPLAAALAAALVVAVVQTGGLVAWQAARPDLARLSPAVGLRKLLGARAWGDVGRGLIKVALVGAVAIAAVRSAWRALPGLVGAGPVAVVRALGFVAERLALGVAGALLAWGVVDWLLVRHRHRRSLMMTRDEVKRELKESEGDPQRKLERQRLHRELGEQRMIDDVRKADFVVVNPDHIAVAVRYDRDVHQAPVVVAKGERLLAERIRRVAREAGVPIFRDLGLARALHELPEGHEIPEALYEAVAELLSELSAIEAGGGGAAGMSGTDGTKRSEADEGAGAAEPASAAATGASRRQESPGATWKRV